MERTVKDMMESAKAIDELRSLGRSKSISLVRSLGCGKYLSTFVFGGIIRLLQKSVTTMANNVGNTPSTLSFGTDVRVKAGENWFADVHDLRLLCNWHLQWCFVNAKTDSAYFKLTETAEWKMPLGGPEARNQEIHESEDSRKLFYVIHSFTGLQNQLCFCCQYWIIVATMAVSERIGDAFISWISMYSEAKLAFCIYLWFPKTKGATYVYDSFFGPMGLMHEPEIDHNLLELRTAAGDIALMYWRKAASYGQTRRNILNEPSS